MVDARGLSCPTPVVMTKNAIAKNTDGVTVLVDNKCAVENVSRFAYNNGYKVNVKEENGEYTLVISK